ncbi:hypothetical protein BDN70DRAFT_860709 [Pholiota conissans]|uniref:BTB domain-containing protein n=1 Tax=Pholiota conissans TaxID=109636 RepID=A0A9P6CZA0_9AGAR|nr:hypothetical protein BDN70DRAFT_860709 [Pholiota conissans]
MSNNCVEEQITVGPSAPKKNREYWLEGDFVVFQVEDELFRVPSYKFSRNSEIFAGMFNLPQGYEQDHEREGGSEMRPIILPGVHAMHFHNFLKALYPEGSTRDMSGLSAHELNSVLRLSTMWYFLDLRAEAIVRLNCMLTPASKVALGRAYQVSAFFTNGLESLLKRDAPLTDEEAETIQPMTAVSLYRLRETYKQKSYQFGGYITPTIEREISDMIAQAFGEELESIRREEKGYNK